MEDEGDDKDDTKRRTRNLSEKKRRDQFNLLVHELSTMVSTNSRKMDKSTVLKSTISFLKNHNEVTVRSRVHDVREDWKPTFLSNEEFTYLMLEALEGFVMVFSSTGRICYVSENIKPLLGHKPTKVVNQSIFDFTCEEDRPILYNLLQRNVAATEQVQSVSKDKEMVTFNLHLRRGSVDYGDDPTYELVIFNGHFRSNFNNVDTEHETHQQEMEPRACNVSSVLFVGTGRLQMPQLIRDVSLVDPNRSEFTSRHSLEWKFLFLDHRAPPIIGYLPFEVLGTSGYDYYHYDDLEKVVACHEELRQKGVLTSCYYRFLTKGQQWIWLQSRFYITYHQWNAKPEFVVCTHRVISTAEIERGTKKEDPEMDEMSEVDANCSIKQAPSEETATNNLSPSYMSEANDAFVSSYRGNSPVDPHSRSVKNVPSDDTTTAAMSPSYMSEASEPYGSSYQSHSQAGSKRQRVDASGTSDDAGLTPMSPSYMSEIGDNYTTYTRVHSQPASVKSASSVQEASWRRARRYAPGSDTGSVSGDSHSSVRHTVTLDSHSNTRISSREKRHVGRYERYNVVMLQQSHRGGETSLAPQHGIGAQYLDPVPYVGVPGVGVPAVLPLPLRPVPVIVTQDQAQIQEQLQRKHEELQQMIVRQQEELQQVKEQLLLARLGILQPVINVPYANPEQLQQQQQVSQPQITYDPAVRVPSTVEYSLPYHGHALPAPPAPPAPPGPHHRMPQ